MGYEPADDDPIIVKVLVLYFKANEEGYVPNALKNIDNSDLCMNVYGNPLIDNFILMDHENTPVALRCACTIGNSERLDEFKDLLSKLYENGTKDVDPDQYDYIYNFYNQMKSDAEALINGEDFYRSDFIDGAIDMEYWMKMYDVDTSPIFNAKVILKDYYEEQKEFMKKDPDYSKKHLREV